MAEQMTIYECDHIIAQIESKVDENGEISEDDMRTLVLAQTTSLERLGKMCAYMKYLEGGIKLCDGEVARINKMKNKANRRLASIKDFLVPYVKAKKRVTIGTFQLSTRKSASVKLMEGFDNKEWCDEKTSYIPDKNKIKQALQDGQEIGGAELNVKDNLQLK